MVTSSCSTRYSEINSNNESVQLLLLLLLFYSRLLFITLRSSGKSGSQQDIKVIYPSTLRMRFAVFISVIFCSSMTDG